MVFTSSFNLDLLAPDFSLTTASGLDYSTLGASPEPATLLLLGTTMTGLGLVARWRRRKLK